MAEREDGLKRLQQLLASFDEDALAALGSKGLLRRAQGDLEKGEVKGAVVGGEQKVSVQVGEETVTFPEAGPVGAECTCPAPETCRHILAACLYVKGLPAHDGSRGDAPDATAQTPTPAGEWLLGLSLAQLTRWAGKASVREAAAILGKEPEPHITEGDALVVAFPQSAVECRVFPAGELDSAIVSGAPPRKGRTWVAAAVLAYLKAQGRELTDLPQARERSGAAAEEQQARPRVLAAASDLLSESLRVGLSNLSAAVAQRFTTLAVSAQGARLHRLALGLRSVADEIGRLVRRDAQSGEDRLFVLMARVHALCMATQASLPSPPKDLVGRERSSYSETGTLALTGLGAYPWLSRSGYEGLTVVFWDERARRWLTWSDVRPQSHAGIFDSFERYRRAAPWSGASTPEKLSRSRFELCNGRRNHLNRLSGSTGTSAVISGPTRLHGLDLADRAFGSWSALREYAQSTTSLGLREALPTDALVVLRPHRWGRRFFEPISQTLYWELLDPDGDCVPIQVRYESIDQPCVGALEGLRPRGDAWWVLGMLSRREAEVSLFPISVLRPGHRDDEVLNLAFDTEQGNEALTRLVSGLKRRLLPGHRSTPDVHLSAPAAGSSALTARIGALEEALQDAAERGGRALGAGTKAALARIGEDLREVGLSVLARSVDGCLAAKPDPSGALLRARYVCHLHRQLMGQSDDETDTTTEAADDVA